MATIAEGKGDEERLANYCTDCGRFIVSRDSDRGLEVESMEEAEGVPGLEDNGHAWADPGEWKTGR